MYSLGIGGSPKLTGESQAREHGGQDHGGHQGGRVDGIVIGQRRVLEGKARDQVEGEGAGEFRRGRRGR